MIPESYALIPRLLASLVLVFSIIYIRYYIRNYADGKCSAREILITTHTVLFTLQISVSLANYILCILSDPDLARPRPHRAHHKEWAEFKSYYITGAVIKGLNLAILLLFFYMASLFNGRLLTAYKQSFEKLQELAVFAAKEGHQIRTRLSNQSF